MSAFAALCSGIDSPKREESMIYITAMTTMCVDVFDSTGEIFPGGEALNFAAVAWWVSSCKSWDRGRCS